MDDYKWINQTKVHGHVELVHGLTPLLRHHQGRIILTGSPNVALPCG